MHVKRLLLIAVAALILGVLWIPTFRDHSFLHLPIYLSLDEVSSGLLPAFLHPGLNAGVPLLGDPNTLALYPVTFLTKILPASVAYGFHFFFHLFLSGYFLYRIAREKLNPDAAFLSAAAWLTAGPFLSSSVSINMFTTVCLIPVVYYATVPRVRPGFAAVALTLQIFAGEWVLAAATIAVILFLSEERIRVVQEILLSLLVSLPLFIATSHFAGFSTRGQGLFTAGTSLIASLHPARIPGMLLPFSFGNIADFSDLWWGGKFTHAPDFLLPTLHLVWILPAAFIVSKKKYPLLAVQVLLLFVAFGAYNPVITLLAERFPLLNIARFPVKLIIPVIFLLVIQISWERVKTGMILSVGVGLTLAAILFKYFLSPEQVFSPEFFTVLFFQWIMLLFLGLREKLRATLLSAALICYSSVFLLPVLHLDLRGGVIDSLEESQVWIGEEDIIYDTTGFQRSEFENFRQYVRYACSRGLQPTGITSNVKYRFAPDVAGSWSVLHRLLREKLERSSWQERVPVLKAFGVTKVFTREPIEHPDLTLKSQQPGYFVYSVSNPMPEAYVVYHAVTISNPQRAADSVASIDFDPSGSVLLAGRDAEEGEPHSYTLVKNSIIQPDVIDIRVELDRPGYLVIQRTFYPAFKFTVDGKEIRSIPGNLSLTALKLPEGTHDIHGSFPKKGFYLSIFLAFIALCGVGYRAWSSIL